MSINSDVITLSKQISKMNSKLNSIREVCKHSNKVGVDGGDSGNWCPSDDCYWTDYTCPDCLKQWRQMEV